jgi:hypothetical protein
LFSLLWSLSFLLVLEGPVSGQTIDPEALQEEIKATDLWWLNFGSSLDN